MNFSVSGGELFPDASRHPGLTETLLVPAHVLCFYVFRARSSTNTKLPLKADAVKILIADCPRHVKGISFPFNKKRRGSQLKTELKRCSLDLNTLVVLQSIVSHRLISFSWLLQRNLHRIALLPARFKGKLDAEPRRRSRRHRHIHLI